MQLDEAKGELFSASFNAECIGEHERAEMYNTLGKLFLSLEPIKWNSPQYYIG